MQIYTYTYIFHVKAIGKEGSQAGRAAPLCHQRLRLIFFSYLSFQGHSIFQDAAGAPFIRSTCQAMSKRKGKKRKRVSASYFYKVFSEFSHDPSNCVSLAIILSYGHI